MNANAVRKFEQRRLVKRLARLILVGVNLRYRNLARCVLLVVIKVNISEKSAEPLSQTVFSCHNFLRIVFYIIYAPVIFVKIYPTFFSRRLFIKLLNNNFIFSV